MMAFVPALVLAAATAFCGGAGSDTAPARLSADLRAASSFVEVRPAHSSDEFRREIASALALLKKTDTPVAQATWKAITSGRIRIDELDDMTGADRRHLRTEYEREGLALPADLASELAGYMWDDRVYIARGLTTRARARAIVHEVNHVLNRSEENYRGDLASFREEYRAFLAEELAFGPMPSHARCTALKRRVLKSYDFDIAPDALADRPSGLFR